MSTQSFLNYRSTELIPVLFKTWLGGVIRNNIKYLTYKEIITELDESNFEWKWIKELSVMGQVQTIASVGRNNNMIKRLKKTTESEEVAIIASKGMMKIVNKILKDTK